MAKDIHPIDRLVGQRVRAVRLNRGLSQTALASAIGLTFQQLQKYEKGSNRISASKLYEIAGALNVEVGDFFVGSEAGEDQLVLGNAPTLGSARLDLQIIRYLSEIRNPRVKRQILGLVAAIAKDEPSAAIEAHETLGAEEHDERSYLVD